MLNTLKKNIEDVYLHFYSGLKTVKKWICQFPNVDFYLDVKRQSGRHSGIDNALIRREVNNPMITFFETN